LKPYAENYDMWKEALNSLEEEERCNVNTLLKDWNHDSPNRKDLVEEIQKRMDEALHSKYHDRTTSIGKLLSVLNKFLSAGDVAVSFDPTHAALPWAAVRCVILVSISYRVFCVSMIWNSDYLLGYTRKLNNTDGYRPQ
jgi:hypothetical protein